MSQRCGSPPPGHEERCLYHLPRLERIPAARGLPQEIAEDHIGRCLWPALSEAASRAPRPDIRDAEAHLMRRAGSAAPALSHSPRAADAPMSRTSPSSPTCDDYIGKAIRSSQRVRQGAGGLGGRCPLTGAATAVLGVSVGEILEPVAHEAEDEQPRRPGDGRRCYHYEDGCETALDPDVVSTRQALALEDELPAAPGLRVPSRIRHRYMVGVRPDAPRCPCSNRVHQARERARRRARGLPDRPRR